MQSRLVAAAIALSCLLGGAIACNGEVTDSQGGGGNGDDSALETACIASNSAFCHRAVACGITVYGDLAQCLADSAGCAHLPPGLSPQPQACIDALAAASCDELLEPMPACPQTGSRAIGESCMIPNQCASGACSNLGCGTCVVTAQLGEPCADGGIGVAPLPCAPDLFCASDTHTCIAIDQPDGAPCIESLCGPHTFCATDDTCRTKIHEGDACAPPLQFGCDTVLNLECDPSTQRCTRFTPPGLGERCPQGVCQFGLYCSGTAEHPGRCITGGAEGAACVDDDCIAPATCNADDICEVTFTDPCAE